MAIVPLGHRTKSRICPDSLVLNYAVDEVDIMFCLVDPPTIAVIVSELTWSAKQITTAQMLGNV